MLSAFGLLATLAASEGEPLMLDPTRPGEWEDTICEFYGVVAHTMGYSHSYCHGMLYAIRRQHRLRRIYSRCARRRHAAVVHDEEGAQAAVRRAQAQEWQQPLTCSSTSTRTAVLTWSRGMGRWLGWPFSWGSSFFSGRQST